MRTLIILLFILLIPLSVKAKTTQETPQKIVYDVYIQDSGYFLLGGALFDTEGLGEALRRTIWKQKDARHFVRFNCKMDIRAKARLIMLKDWVLAQYIQGEEKHAKCASTTADKKIVKLHPVMQARMEKRKILKQEKPFVGKWKGERKTPSGKIEYAWEVERKDDGSYNAHFFTPLDNGKKETIQEVVGFWWVAKGLYHEVQDNSVLMPDIYKFNIQNQKILFDQKYNTYQFTDFKYE